MSNADALPSQDDIEALDLPDRACRLLDRYEERIGRRPRYLWKWLYAVFPRYRLSAVPDDRESAVRERKLLLTVFYTVLDDLADTRGDEATFLEARKLPLPGARPRPDAAGVDPDALAVAEAAWEAATEKGRDTPRAEEFWSLFRFDVEQVVNAMHHGYIVGAYPDGVTEQGARRLGVHNMAQFSYATLDVLSAPAFDRRDLRPLRRTVWPAQRLARIANWLATWERELQEGDYTSGIVLSAIEADVVSIEEVTGADVRPATLAARIRDNGIERAFHEEWDRIYDDLQQRPFAAETVDLDDYVAGMADMRDLYLDNRGRI